MKRTTGQVLITFGRAFSTVATAQEVLGRSLGSSLIVALHRFLDQIKDYEAERKKLETRRWEWMHYLHPENLESNAEYVTTQAQQRCRHETS
jgi:hypothetical protein